MRSCPLQRSLGRIKHGLHFLNRHWLDIFESFDTCHWLYSCTNVARGVAHPGETTRTPSNWRNSCAKLRYSKCEVFTALVCVSKSKLKCLLWNWNHSIFCCRILYFFIDHLTATTLVCHSPPAFFGRFRHDCQTLAYFKCLPYWVQQISVRKNPSLNTLTVTRSASQSVVTRHKQPARVHYFYWKLSK